ncbi:MAG TPA: hypothetical protein VLA12_07090, partial [Planctomycetaceae bacterium]|nr:hypothetical protein [Planctomycetaceae bacterium]
VEKLFGISLGPQGQFVLHSLHDADRRKAQLLSGNGHKYSLRQLLVEHDRLSRELEESQHSQTRLRALRDDLAALDRKIESLRKRKEGVSYEHRGHQFIQRIHGPWQQIRDLQKKLADLPDVRTFPENGLKRLDEFERQLEESLEERAVLRSESERIVAEIRQLRSSAPSEISAMRLLLRQHELLQPQLTESESLQAQIEAVETELQHRLSELGEPWTLERLEAFEWDAETQQTISRAADAFRNCLRKRAKARAAIERLSKKIQAEQAELQEQSARWQGQSVEQMRERTERQIRASRDHERRALKKAELETRLAGIERQRESLLHREPLPKGVRYLLTGFAVFGCMLALLGFYRGITVSGLTGAVYTLLGLTCGGLGFALKWHFSNQQEEQLRELSRTNDELTKELSLLDQDQSADGGQKSGSTSTDVIALTEKLKSLSLWADRDQKLHSARRRASQLRLRLQEILRDVSRHREEWLRTLRHCGLQETVKFSEAWNEWNQVGELADRAARLELLKKQAAGQTQISRVFEKSVRSVRKKHAGEAAEQSVAQILNDWETLLSEQSARREQRKQLEQVRLEKRTRLRELAGTIKELKWERAGLLKEAGATDRLSFEQRAEWYQQVTRYREQLSLVDRELGEIASEEPELVISEDDLLQFDSVANRRKLEVLTEELDVLTHELENAHEIRGETRQEFEALTRDRRNDSLNQELAENDAQIKSQCERWLGVDSASRAMTEFKTKLEQEQRPETLQRAERYFRQLTGSRYHRLWAPLGELDVHVEDHAGLTKSLNELSGGTREQLLLALRLSLMEELREKGMKLPFILDDILVNFDESRIRAAMDTLIQFAAGGTEVILLTCHQHLADTFAERPTVAIANLPERTPYPERLAG